MVNKAQQTKIRSSRFFNLRTTVYGIIIATILLFTMMFWQSIQLSNAYVQINRCNQQMLDCTDCIAELDRSAIMLTRQASHYIRQHSHASIDDYYGDIVPRADAALEALHTLGDTMPDSAALAEIDELYRFMRAQDAYAMRLTAAAQGVDEALLPPELAALSLSPADAALSPDQMLERALTLVCSTPYNDAYNQFWRSLEAFRQSADAYQRQLLQAIDQRTQQSMYYLYASMFLLLGLSLATCSASIRGILRPLEGYIDSIEKGEPFQIDGVRELQDMARSYNESYSRNVENQEKLRLRAERDPMTGLLNQGNFGVLKQRLSKPDYKLGLMVMDVDYFKHINDAYGHETGNRMLQMIATMLVEHVDPADYVIRYGGDEFVVVMPNCTRADAKRLERLIGKLNDKLQQPEDGLPAVSLSVGASFSESGFHDKLFQQADQAMYEVKRRGRCGFAVYQVADPEEDAASAPAAEQTKPRILIVDDSEMNRAILRSMLEEEYEVYEAVNGMQAIEEISLRGYNLTALLLDLVMPVCDGYEVLNYMKKHRWIEVLPVIVISSETDPTCINRAYDLGATDFISRPFDAQIVRRRVSNTVGINLKYKRMTDLLTRKIQEKIEGYDMMLSVLSQVVEFRNQESGNHVMHIGLIADLLLDYLMKGDNPYGLTHEDVQQIRFASALHDIGKITIPDEIINKPGRLTPQERTIMETHSLAGAELLERVQGFAGDPLFHRAWEICRWHHERYDGRGYPDGLVGDAIPISAQVVSVADVYDALTSERCYKPAFTHEEALAMILNGDCGTFNPRLLEALTAISDQLVELMQEEAASTKWNYDASRLVEEMSHLGEMDITSRMMLQFQFEQSSTAYFRSLAGGYTFSYRADTELLMMSPALAKLLDAEEIVQAPAQDEALLARSGKMQTSWHSLLGDTSPEDAERTMRIVYGEGDQARVFRCNVRTIWSAEEAPQYLGLVGAMLLEDEH